jgi:hypothetical protein
MLGSFCIPYDDSYVNKDTFIAFKKAFFESSYGAATAFVACIFGYCYLLIIRFIGGVIIWATLAVSIIILASSGFYTYFHARP